MKPISLPTLKEELKKFHLYSSDISLHLIKVIEKMQEKALKIIQGRAANCDEHFRVACRDIAREARAEVRKLVEFGDGKT